MLSKAVDIAIAERIGHFLVMNKRQTALVDLELTKMFRETIKRTRSVQETFLWHLFLVKKKDEGYFPVINLSISNQFIPSLHLKYKTFLN